MAKTVQVARYEPIRVEVTREAQIEEGDDAAQVIQKLQYLCHADCQSGVEIDMEHDWH